MIMKIKFNSDDDLPLHKTKEIPSMTIAVGAIFLENIIHIFSSMNVYINYEYTMLYFDRIDVSEGIDVN